MDQSCKKHSKQLWISDREFPELKLYVLQLLKETFQPALYHYSVDGCPKYRLYSRISCMPPQTQRIY